MERTLKIAAILLLAVAVVPLLILSWTVRTVISWLLYGAMTVEEWLWSLAHRLGL